MDLKLPLITEPDALEECLEHPDLLLVDLSRAEVHHEMHIPGAVPLHYSDIVAAHPPVAGLLPQGDQLSRVLSAIGLESHHHVVAYDDEGGGKAARLLWTLECIGHRRYSLLNGGLHAWANEGHRLTGEPTTLHDSHYQAHIVPESPAIAHRGLILHRLGDPTLSLLDVRAPDEYNGSRRFSARGGHIPGAVNIEWTAMMDPGRNLRLLPERQLRTSLERLSVTPDKTVVVYCQTHHRSAHSYIVLRSLGYPDVRGYHGSWSDWGNRDDTPIE